MNMNKILAAICISTSILSFSSCKDDLYNEITTLEVGRAFSPTGLDVRVVNKTGARLNWKAVNNASSYTIEFFENADFSGSPAKTIENITFEQVPYTVSGLSGETEYFVRVKAVGQGVEDSKWVTGTFKTDAEQIFQDINLEKLTAKSVTLNWPAGETATTITIAPGNITHSVTPAEVAAGEVTISGLTGETTYTAKLFNGPKVRGTKTFTTLIDLGGAIAVNPGDDLATLLTNAAGGEVFALMPGTHNVNADVIVSKSISIKGAKPADKPIVNGLFIKLRGNAGLSLKDLVIVGPGTTSATLTNQPIIYDEASDIAYGPLVVQDCEIKNFVKGIIYANNKTLIESVTYSGNLIYNIECNGSDFVDFRNGIAKTFLFENNTVYNVASSTTTGARDLFRMDAGGSTNFSTITSAITIRTNTFYNASNADGKRYLYIRLAKHTIDFSKNVVANSAGLYSNQAATTITTVANNNYFNAANFYQSTASGAKNDNSGTYTTLDPQFTNPSAGNFTVGNENLKFAGVGDPRWRK